MTPTPSSVASTLCLPLSVAPALTPSVAHCLPSSVAPVLTPSVAHCLPSSVAPALTPSVAHCLPSSVAPALSPDVFVSLAQCQSSSIPQIENASLGGVAEDPFSKPGGHSIHVSN